MKMLNRKMRRWYRRNVLAYVQRGKRGFADSDLMSGDYYLARIFADILEWYVENSMGISSDYFWTKDNKSELTWDEGKAIRDAEYKKYAEIFRRYSVGGVWESEAAAENLKGITYKEYKDAFKWFGKVFTGLWD